VAYLSNIVQFLTARLAEPSTWRGIAWVLTSIGIMLTPDQVAALTVAGAGVSGVIGIFTTEAKQ
jgi:hypothetical protein